MAIISRAGATADEIKLSVMGAVVDIAKGFHALVSDPDTLNQLGINAAKSVALVDHEIDERSKANQTLALAKDYLGRETELRKEIDALRQSVTDQYEINLKKIDEHRISTEAAIADSHDVLEEKKKTLEAYENQLQVLKDELDTANQTHKEKAVVLADKEDELKNWHERLTDWQKKKDAFIAGG